MKFPLIGKLLFACAMIVFLGGCTDEVTETVYVDFSLSRYSVVFPVSGGTNTVSVVTDDSWSANTNAEWLTLNVDGSTLYITAEANTETATVRQAEVTVTTSSSGSESISVRQEPVDSPDLSLNYAGLSSIDSEGGEVVISVVSNYDWTAAVVENIEGWELTADASLGTVTLTAGVNNGDPLTGTIRVTAGEGNFSTYQDVEVSQDSHANNGYFKYLGNWDVYADKWYYNDEYLESGVYDNCSIAELNYSARQYTMADFCYDGLTFDGFEYYPETGKIILPMGYLCGYIFMSGYYWYIYLVTIGIEDGIFSSYFSITGTLSEDGQTIELSDFDSQCPCLGFVGYNTSYYYFSLMSNMTYPISPMHFSRSSAEPSAAPASLGGVEFHPITSFDELPEGVPARLPDGFKGTFGTTVMF
ncbi:MAG: BACON domain-containing protein [Bacteroidales bacterium]|nr:BACON domain-containing protein [Bacteroidales bacterium]